MVVAASARMQTTAAHDPPPASDPPRAITTVVLTVVTLTAFAANSLLCRLALAPGSIDAASFLVLRFTSAAAVLLVVRAARDARGVRAASGRRAGGSWSAAGALFVYGVCFSWAYVSLATGTGALVLFAAVQLTMIAYGLWTGERPRPGEWIGLGLALVGLVVLVSPGLEAPSPGGAALMALAGIGWGAYSLAGRRSGDPIDATAGNFVRALVPSAAVGLLAWPGAHASREGIVLALLSGALASGLGYVIWYAALRGLTATRAAIVQLTVPAIAAAGGVAFLDEAVTLRLLAAGGAILGGVGLAISQRAKVQPR